MRLSLRFGLAIITLGAVVLGPVVLGAATPAEAQTITVQGQVQVQAQPQGYAQPPPGYGQAQPSAPTSAPTYAPTRAPTYAPTYAPVQRRVSYEDRETSVKAIWIPGIIVFGVSWILDGTLGSFSFDSDYSTWSWIPLVGPWVALTYANNDDETLGAALAGAGQLVGVGMFILGIAMTRTVRVAVYSFDEHDDMSPRLAFDALPTPGGAQLGMTLSHF